MCELFGFCSGDREYATSCLEHFAGHSGRNPHGWGLSYYTDDGAVIKKEAVEARKSVAYYAAIGQARSNIILSHIRHASCGKINEANCHPFLREFQGKEWTFAHNGHVDGVARHPGAYGETDSESVFNMLLDNVREYRSLDNGTVYKSLIKGVSSLFNDYEFGRQVGLNFVMSDGSILYAFNHHAEKPMYYSASAIPGALVVSTRRLGGGAWETLPADRLMLVKRGAIAALSDPI